MTKPAGALRTEAERNLALLAYGMLGASIFFAGVTALVAVFIAYALHNAATEELSSHFRFQIRIFWIGLACVVLLGISATVATFGALGNLLHDAAPADMVDQVEVFGRRFDVSGLRITPLVIVATTIAAASAILGALWMVCASAFGFMRLASSRHMGETARP